MLKDELIATLAEQTGSTKVLAKEMAETFMALVVQNAVRDGKVLFGKHIFRKRVRPAREARNPRTGEKVQVAEKTKITYALTV